MTRNPISYMRSWLYWLSRFLGDVNAIERGPGAVCRRVERRYVGKMAGRALWRLFR